MRQRRPRYASCTVLGQQSTSLGVVGPFLDVRRAVLPLSRFRAEVFDRVSCPSPPFRFTVVRCLLWPHQSGDSSNEVNSTTGYT